MRARETRLQLRIGPSPGTVWYCASLCASASTTLKRKPQPCGAPCAGCRSTARRFARRHSVRGSASARSTRASAGRRPTTRCRRGSLPSRSPTARTPDDPSFRNISPRCKQPTSVRDELPQRRRRPALLNRLVCGRLWRIALPRDKRHDGEARDRAGEGRTCDQGVPVRRDDALTDDGHRIPDETRDVIA